MPKNPIRSNMTADTKDISKVLTEIDESDTFLDDPNEAPEDVFESEPEDDRDVPDDVDEDTDEAFNKRWYGE